MTEIREGAVFIVERLHSKYRGAADPPAARYIYTDGQWTRRDSVLVDISYVDVKSAIESLTAAAASFGGIEEAELEISVGEEHGNFDAEAVVSGFRPANDAELSRIKKQRARTTQVQKDQVAKRAKLKTAEVAAFIEAHPELAVRPR